MTRALKVGARRSASYVNVLTPSTFASWAYSRKIVLRVKSKTSQSFIRALFFRPSFDSLLHCHLSSNCLYFQPVATTRKCVDTVFPFHHHAFEIQFLEFFEESFSIAGNVISKPYATGIVLRQD